MGRESQYSWSEGCFFRGTIRIDFSIAGLMLGMGDIAEFGGEVLTGFGVGNGSHKLFLK